jgi:DNA-binding transcriptional MerR regulator
LGHICGKRYERGAIPDDETLRRDLLDIVDIYRRLKTIIGTEAIEERVKAIIVEQEKIPDISGEEILEIPEKTDLESVTEVVAGESKFIDRVGDDLNTREVSERAKLSGVETEKYLSALEKAGFFSSEIVDGERFYPVESPALVAKLAAFSGQGFSIEEAIEIIKGGGAIEAKKLKDLEKNVEKLSNNVDLSLRPASGILKQGQSANGKERFLLPFQSGFQESGKKEKLRLLFGLWHSPGAYSTGGNGPRLIHPEAPLYSSLEGVSKRLSEVFVEVIRKAVAHIFVDLQL